LLLCRLDAGLAVFSASFTDTAPPHTSFAQARLQREADAFAEQKKVGNEKLMVCSLKYRDIMRKEREVA